MTKIENSGGEILPPQPASEVYKPGDRRPEQDYSTKAEKDRAVNEPMPIDTFTQSLSSPRLLELQEQLVRLEELEELEDQDHTDHTVKMRMALVKDLIAQEENRGHTE